MTTFAIPRGARPSKCKSCGARVFWVTTPNGKKMPANPDGVSHFDTCVNAAAHRRPRPTRANAAKAAQVVLPGAYVAGDEAANDAAIAERAERMLAWDWNGKGPPCRGCGLRHGPTVGCDGSELKGG